MTNGVKEMSMKTQKRKRVFALILALALTLTVFTGCEKKPAKSGDSASVLSAAEEHARKRSKADQKQLKQDIEDGYLILVNKENFLPSDYIPEDLEELKYYAKDRSPDARYLKETAAEHFHEMVEAAQEENIDIVSTTAYRSYEFQKNLYDYYVKTKGQEEADKVSAKPGTSEHQTGLVADLSTSEINYVNGSAFGNSKAGKWIAEHSWEYGFIVRYPEGLEDITGYTYEPWHVRYVGLVAAKEIHDEDITLEEYIEENHLGNSIKKVVSEARNDDETDDNDGEDSSSDKSVKEKK